MNKKTLFSLYTVGLLFIVVFSIGMFGLKHAQANPSSLNAYFVNASSSPDWIPRLTPSQKEIKTTVGTTTLSFGTEGVDTIYVPAWLIASSSATVVNMKVYFSYNNVDWFAEDAVTVTSNILMTHASTTVDHVWQPATTATSTKEFVISNVGARYTKITMELTGANGALWFAAFTKAQK
jgi:hypothetical protein